ncbi:hypothetical protein [Ornithinimicrobium murale]|uniref:hypothetical protein n=1 Tax=Ornithinimicrobium murale TaxID=1050153 RepID=UPI000E0D24FB|nr:hypothetical protein [Ornithinimicrobium murale]
MSVATQLGLHDPDSDLLHLARCSWPHWQQAHPSLRVVEDLLDLPVWVVAHKGTANEVLLSLAELSAVDGSDDPAASAALVWLLLPGACLAAHRLRRWSDRIDEVVAAQLWIEARTTNWRSGYNVAANVLMNTRKGVLRDLGVPSPDRDRHDRSWSMTDLTEDPDGAAAHRGEGEPSITSDFCYDLLAEAVETGVLSGDDCRCLLELADAVEVIGETRVNRGSAGLLGKRPTTAVATQWGVSRETIARRARRAVRALRDEYAGAEKVLSA